MNEDKKDFNAIPANNNGKRRNQPEIPRGNKKAERTT
ncbi:MAG: hypothetical protein ACFWTP_03905 [Enterococcus gilvus]|jgi:hypothetical protein